MVSLIISYKLYWIPKISEDQVLGTVSGVDYVKVLFLALDVGTADLFDKVCPPVPSSGVRAETRAKLKLACVVERSLNFVLEGMYLQPADLSKFPDFLDSEGTLDKSSSTNNLDGLEVASSQVFYHS